MKQRGELRQLGRSESILQHETVSILRARDGNDRHHLSTLRTELEDWRLIRSTAERSGNSRLWYAVLIVLVLTYFGYCAMMTQRVMH
jgi:hypothetical protein